MLPRIPLALTVIAASLLPSKAADISWQAASDAAWENTANWSGGVLPGSVSNQNDTAIFGDPTGLLNPVLSTTQPPEDGFGRIQRVHFQNAGWTLSGDGVLRLLAGTNVRCILSAGEGVNTISAPIQLLSDAHIEILAGNQLVLPGVIEGIGSRRAFRFYGPGSVLLTGNVVNVKDFNVYGGCTIELNMPTRMGTDFEDRVEGGSTVRLLADEQCRIHWPRYTQNGVFDLNGHTQTFQGLTFGHHNADARFTVKTGEEGLLRLTGGLGFQPYSWNDRNRTGTPVVQGRVELAASGFRDMTVVEQNNAAVQIRVEAVISGVGGVSCRGDGTLQFTASNTYAGNTRVVRATLGSRTDAGRLIIDGGATETSSGTGMGTGAVTVEGTGLIGGSGVIGHVGRTGATLSLTGDMVGEVVRLATVAPGGVEAGTFIGTLGVNGNASLNDYSRLAVDLGNSSVGDTLAVNGVLSVSTTGTVLDLTPLEGTTLAGDYTLATFDSLTGTFSEVRFDTTVIADPFTNGAVGGTHQLAYTATQLLLKQSPPPGTLMLVR